MTIPVPPHHPDHYQAIRFAVRHRRAVQWSIVALTVALCLYLYWRTAQADWLVATAVLGIAAMLVTRLVLELVQLIAEMLLPR